MITIDVDKIEAIIIFPLKGPMATRVSKENRAFKTEERKVSKGIKDTKVFLDYL